MIKRLIVICIAITSCCIYGQQGTASPYSFYGLGSLDFKGTVENRSMGGISVYLDSIHVNLRNPAAYAGNNLQGLYFNGESRPVKFSIGGSMSELKLEGDAGTAKTNTAVFDYIAFSIPVGRFGFGFGLLPFTSVGYRLQNLDDEGNLLNRFDGEGGVNRVFGGLGYQITNKLSVGVDFNYNFGNIENSALVVAYTPEGQVVQFQTRENNRSDLSGLNVNFGLSYKTMVTNKLELSLTTTYAPESQLSSDNERSLITVLLNPFTGFESTSTVSEVDLAAINLAETDLTLPSRFSIGAGIGEPKSWFVGAEYTFQNTSAFSNPIFSNQTTQFENASEFAIGGFFIPRYNAFSGYYKRMVYRAGLNFSNTGLVINGESINEFGMSFGLGLPVGSRNLFSNANIGVEFGRRGTTRQNLIQENFITLNLGLSLNSRWFEQKKYN